ncbi:MAG TPA: hypothetical protein VFX92_03085 [Candidatus Krumholzibacteria bacterium]|nr:hypothetical protein [Candidatus Krumholzibacteria bacterium]
MDRAIVEDIRRSIEEMRREQREVAARQEEILQFLRAEAEHAHKIREEAIALQRVANGRVRRISMLAVPGILLCVSLIVYLSAKYHVLF